MAAVISKAFGWGGSIAGVRMVCSLISIKVTAVYLGPAGLALVAQFSNFMSLFQSMLGQGLVTGAVRLASEHGTDPVKRRAVYSTALQMGAVMAAALCVILVFASSLTSQFLLTDEKYRWLIAFSGLGIAAAMMTDIVYGALGVTKEIGLIGISTIGSTIVGLLIFAPSCYQWGITGGLAATLVVIIVSSFVSIVLVHKRSRGVKLSEFFGSFDKAECKRIFGFYPMLIVNGVLPPLVLILVRDVLRSTSSLEVAGLWQATWRLSEAYQAIIISSISLYFMPSIGERINQPRALRRRILRTLAAASGITAVLGLGIAIFRREIVDIVFSHKFSEVSAYLPIQVIGDVLKMSGWILCMSLVAKVRTAWFIAVISLNAVMFCGLSRLFVPTHGIEAVLWSYACAGLAQLLLGAYALRDILWQRSTELAIDEQQLQS